MTDNVLYWIATAPLGASSVLAEELKQFGASDIKERSHDVKFQGTLEVGYRACLWSRTVTRLYLSLGQVDASSTQALFEALKRIDWRPHFSPGTTLACECSGGNESIRHTLYGSQLLKDAVCDSLRETTGARPDIRPERPDVLLHLHVEGATAVVSLDFAGESLHQRGYRTATGPAPLKENVAAAMLLRSGWPQIAQQQGALLDPMCGSGTLLTEAALIAADIAPALYRDYFGFLGWRGHDAALWEGLLSEARTRSQASQPRRMIIGYDIDPGAVRMSLANAEAAGVSEWIHVEKRGADALVPPVGYTHGLIAVNPPYGERLGAEADLAALYAHLGAAFRDHFGGWQVALLTGNPGLARNLGLYAKRTHRVMNGAIECRLLRFDLDGVKPKPREQVRAEWSARPGAQMFANRLRKNLERLSTWAAREQVECFRVYDADMPEYAFAVDLYRAIDGLHVHIQEYAPPKTVNEDSARNRRREVLTVLPDVLDVPLTHVHSRVRKAQKGAEQYEKRSEAASQRLEVHEAGLKFLVNFRDYLDTGLFLDHRMVRGMLRDWARGADFLNLFCYTGSATVYAAAGGARSTTSVDLSNTYLDWAGDNLRLNGFLGREHAAYRADCLSWLAEREPGGAQFDLIFLDPPTFSNSKRTESVLDVQRDHVGMIRRAVKLLRPGGRLVFSTNYRRFKLDAAALEDLAIDDVSAASIPRDFERHANIHRCFVLRFR